VIRIPRGGGHLRKDDESLRFYVEHKLWDARREGRTTVDIVAGLISRRGYETRVVPRPPGRWLRVDDHIDIVATPRPRCRHLPPIKTKVVFSTVSVLHAAALTRRLGPGEAGWLVAAWGVGDDVKDYVAARPGLRLVGHEDIVDMMIEEWDGLIRSLENAEPWR
jgi:hypothetical protein